MHEQSATTWEPLRRRKEETKDEKSKCGSRLRKATSPGIKSMVVSAAVVPPVTDRWKSQSGCQRLDGPTHTDARTFISHLTSQEINIKLCNSEDVTKSKDRDAVFLFECFAEEIFRK